MLILITLVEVLEALLDVLVIVIVATRLTAAVAIVVGASDWHSSPSYNG